MDSKVKAKFFERKKGKSEEKKVEKEEGKREEINEKVITVPPPTPQQKVLSKELSAVEALNLLGKRVPTKELSNQKIIKQESAVKIRGKTKSNEKTYSPTR